MKRGKEQVKAELLTLGQAIIIKELRKIPKFKKSMHELAEQFPDMASVEDFKYPLDIMIAEGSLKEDSSPNIQRMEEYVGCLHGLADSYNLRCGWIIEGFHHMIRHAIDPSIRTSISNWYIRLMIDRLKIDVPICDDTRKEGVQDSFDKEWQRMKSKHPELQGRDRIPENFKRHVEWLCYRLFYGRTGKNIAKDGLENPKNTYTAEYIDSSISKAAKILGIKLSRGRPCKSKKKRLRHPT